jgi:hypothetical protein
MTTAQDILAKYGVQAPTAGSGKQTQPQARTTRTSTTISPKFPFVSKTITESEGKSAMDIHEQRLSIQGKEADLAKKKANESQEEYLNAVFKLTQSTMLFDKMNDWNKRNLGFDPPAAFGIRGGVNTVMGRVLKANPYVEAFEGDRYTTAMALMRAIMPGRAERMVEGVMTTLPGTFASDEIADVQVVQSVIQAMGTYVSRNPREFPELLNAKGVPDENKVSGFLAEKEVMARKIVENSRSLATGIPVHARTDNGLLMTDDMGNIELVPYTRYAEANAGGMRAINEAEASALKGGR